MVRPQRPGATDSYEQKRPSPPESAANQEQHIYHCSVQRCLRLLQKHARALKSDWWERKAVELQRAADSNNMKGFYNGLKEVWGPKKKGPVELKLTDGMEALNTARELWQDGVNTSRSNSTSLTTEITKLWITSRSALQRQASMRFQLWMGWLELSPA